MLHVDKIILFDGAFGTELEKYGFDSKDAIDINISHPEIVQRIHKSYKDSQYTTTNTFGLNSLKYNGNNKIKDICKAAINNAKTTGKKIAFDIGPTGCLLKPLGTTTFDQAYMAFKEVVEYSQNDIDVYLLETFTDLYEIKAAILAIKETCDKPIIASMSFDKKCRTLTGSPVEIVVNTLTSLGVDAIGANCGSDMKNFDLCIKKMCDISKLPIIVQPNRGIPQYINGKSVYDMSIDLFESYIKKFLEYGVSIIGGCCGTNPEIINRISKYKNNAIIKKDFKENVYVNSSTKIRELNKITICGERINPTGNKKIKNALLDSNYSAIINEAIIQSDAGADILDVNIGLGEISEEKVLPILIQKIQEVVDTPLQIDTSDIKALEKSLRYYNGVPIINSVCGKADSMNNIFPLAYKYGANIIALLLDEDGIPKTCEKRLKIADKIIKTAKEYKIDTNKIIFDCLILSAGTSQNLVKECLKTIQVLSSKGYKTTLGISNVSYGLPNRKTINGYFLSMALACGLTMPIINPLDDKIKEALLTSNVLLGHDNECKTWISAQNSYNNNIVSKTKKHTKQTLKDAIVNGNSQNITEIVNKSIRDNDKLEIINNSIIPALDIVGKKYEQGLLFLPQLMSSANAAKIAFEELSNNFSITDQYKGTIILCTVKGDVHDIGKNICKVIIQSHGFKVIDLGKDVSTEEIIESYNKHKPFAIGLSALMTSTLPSMEESIKALKTKSCKSKIFVGGAVLSSEIAKNIGADYYTKDAIDFVEHLNKIRKS